MIRRSSKAPALKTFALAAGLLAAGAMAVEASEMTVGDDRIAAFEELESQVRARFEPLPDAGEPDVDGLLINGVPVHPSVFPGVVRMVTGGTCTATLVGPAAMLIAAHCVGDGERIAFSASNRLIAGICEHAPGYHPITGPGNDWAMCLMEFEIGGIDFERIDIDEVPPPGTVLGLTGYGCTEQGGDLDGLLRIGASRVVDNPVPSWPDEPMTIYTQSDPDAFSQAILCPGDSGGPLFRVGADLGSEREIVGVNSRTTFRFGVSLFSATASEEGRAFLTDWTDRHGQKVCGINLDLGCR